MNMKADGTVKTTVCRGCEESKSLYVCVCFPSASLYPAAVLICRWSKGWKGRIEEDEGGRLRPFPGGVCSDAAACWK